MTDLEQLEAARKAAKSLLFMAFTVAAASIIMLMLDQQLKLRVVTLAVEARELLDRAEALANGSKAAEQDGDHRVGGGNAANGGRGGVRAGGARRAAAGKVLDGVVVDAGDGSPGVAAGS